jgi:hypothetical protein
MALKRLRTEEMVTITSTLVDPGHPDHQAMVAVPALAPLVPEIIGSHNGLYATYFTGPGAVRLKEIQDLQKALDVDHDEFTRGLWAYFWAMIYLAPTEADEQVYRRLLASLLPDGLALVNKSYREEAGQAALVQSQLGDDERTALQSMVLRDGRTLLDVVNAWLGVGVQLGALDRERAGDVGDGAPTAADAIAARNRWIRTMQTVREVAALVAAGNPAISEIMARLDGAERAADRRVGRGDDGEDEVPEPGDGPSVPGGTAGEANAAVE